MNKTIDSATGRITAVGRDVNGDVVFRARREINVVIAHAATANCT